MLQGNWSLFLLRENWSLSCCGTPSACEGYVEATGRSCATGVVDDEACPLVDFSGFLERLIFGMTAYSWRTERWIKYEFLRIRSKNKFWEYAARTSYENAEQLISWNWQKESSSYHLNTQKIKKLRDVTVSIKLGSKNKIPT